MYIYNVYSMYIYIYTRYISDYKQFLLAVTVVSSFGTSNSQLCSVLFVLKLSKRQNESRRNGCSA